MSAPRHRLLLASAGTGKTYQLSGHFLRLLFDGVPPEEVLATTFTRKAAGEILDRVLERLLEAVEDDDALAALARDVGPDVDRPACAALLARLTRGFDRFRVRTLDAFFAHVSRLFAHELDLPPGWTMLDELDDEALRAEAVGRVLAGSSSTERTGLLRGIKRSPASRSVYDSMLENVAQGRAAALESDAAAWETEADLAPLDEARLAELGASLEATVAPTTKKGTPNKGFHDGLEALKGAVASGSWSAVLKSGLVGKAVAGEETYFRAPVAPALAELLRALAGHAAAVELASLAASTRTSRAFLDAFDAEYAALKRGTGGLRFEDLPRALAARGPLDEERRAALWFRLDARTRHLLLDEFQDTAPEQFRALAPLVEEVLADGLGERSLFCVGDVKQSIYGWRQAEPRLLRGMAARYPVLSPEPLVKSWRSSQVVLDAVNAVFGALDGAPVFDEDERPGRRAGADSFARGFEPHEAAKALPGAAELRQAVFADDEESGKDAAVRLAIERVVALADAAPDASVGVLVRSRKPIPRLLFELRQRGVRASGEGGNALTDAESVQVFLSALQLADHPGDLAAAFHVASSPLGESLGLPAWSAEAPRDRAAARSAARALRAELLRAGYGRTAARVLAAVEAAPDLGDWDVGRFRQLVDLAHAHDARATLRPAEFARVVRETAVQDPTASRVRVMTIHASKGLEFDAVVLPELGQAFVRDRSPFVLERPDPFGPVTRVAARPRKELRAFSGELRALVDGAEAREVEESLCVLYVAMTRAKRRLELIVPPPPRRSGSSTARDYAALLRQTLGATADEDGVLWRHDASAADWAREVDAEEPPPEGAAERSSLGLAPTRRARALGTHTPSGQEGGAPDAAALLRAPSAGAARGTLVHRLLEELEWVDDADAALAAVADLAAELEPDAAARAAALDALRAQLGAPAIAALLARPDDADALDVRREWRFDLVAPDDAGADALWSGEVDRLVLRREAGAVVAADVIDWKSDRVEGEALAERTAYYRPQLEAYGRAVARRYELDPMRIRLRIAFLHAGEVVDLESDGSRE